MNETRRDALEEVVTTLEGLTMFLHALEQREQSRDPQFELIRDQLEGVANAIRGRMYGSCVLPRNDHVH